MSDGTQMALIAMVGTVLATAIAALVKVYTASVEAKADAAKKDKALTEIHVLVNSQLSKALTEINALKSAISSILPHDPEKAKAVIENATSEQEGAP